MSMIQAERLAEVFVELADTLVDDFDLVEFLQLVATHTSNVIAAQAGGLMLGDAEGRLHFMAASDERVHLLDLFQLQADEGPCRDCYHQGVRVNVRDLTQALPRWPQFAPQALKAGFRSVHAFPMRLRHQIIGTMGLFGDHVTELTPADVRIVQALVDVATIGILQERTIREGNALSEQLQGALNSRVLVEQAKGIISQSYAVDVDQAFEMLRSYCRGTHSRLIDIARLVVTDPASAPDFRTR